LKRMSAIKNDFLKGLYDKREATKLIELTLKQYGALERESEMFVEDVPVDFWLPCECLFCKAERGESPLPIEAIVGIENLRMASRMGMISKFDAISNIKRILQKYNVSDTEALKLWQISSGSTAMGHTGPVGAQVTPLAPEETEFFSSLEEQMKNVPKDEK